MAHQRNSVGWHRYPLNLRSYDPIQQNGESYRQKLQDQSKRLFSKKTPDLKIFETQQNGKINEKFVTSESDLDEYLREDPKYQASRMFYLHRKNSDSPFDLTKEMFQKLLSHLEIFPRFLDIVFELRRTKQSAEGSTPTFTDFCATFETWELCYGLYYVERHGRSYLQDPWSMRQTGIYQKHNSRTWESTWCLLHPSLSFQERMKEVYESPQPEHREALRKATNVHLLLISSVAENWGLYSAELESAFTKMSDKAVHSDLSELHSDDPEKQDFNITFRDSQDIQAFGEKVMGVISALQSNYEAISSLQKKLKPYWGIDAKCVQDVKIPDGGHISGDPLDFYLSQYEVNLRNAHSLLARVKGVSNLLHKIHEFRNLSKLQEYNKHMVNLGKGSVSEAGAMRVITVITLIYLPATFVATVFGMGYIELQGPASDSDRESNNTLKIVIKTDFWAYLVITLVFMAITGAIWFWYDRRVRKRAKKVEGELSLP